MAVIDKVLTGESLVVTEGGDNEIAHIDLIMGPRGSAVEDAFCNTLCNNKDGFTSLLAVSQPNLMVKPATVMFNKVTIKGAKQAVQMFGPEMDRRSGTASGAFPPILVQIGPQEANNLSKMECKNWLRRKDFLRK